MTKFIKHTNPTPDSRRFNVWGSDLFIPVRRRDGTVGYILGDTFGNGGWGDDWRSPCMLIGPADRPGEFTDAAGGPNYARQILPYTHNTNDLGTMLPADVIYVGDRMYMSIMAASQSRGLAATKWTEIWSSGNDGHDWIWHPESKLPGNAFNSNAKMVTFCDGEDGWIYIMKAGWRDKNIILFRCKPDRITFVNEYEAWSNTAQGWKWGVGLVPHGILEEDVRAGEMCLRKIEGQFVLSYFRGSCIEIRTVKNITDNWVAAPVVQPIYNTVWGREDDNHAAQLYGGYIFPGSTLDDMTIIASQWQTGPAEGRPANSIYRGIVYKDIRVPRLGEGQKEPEPAIDIRGAIVNFFKRTGWFR